MLIEFPKIKGIYEYDTSRKPIPTIVDELEPLKNLEWSFTEKIDWTNIRIHWDWHKVAFYGRSEKTNIHVRLLERLQELFFEELFEQVFEWTEVILFGEGYGGKIQHGIRDYKEKEDFILFDVYINGIWLQRESIEEIATKMWIEVVPLILKGTLDDGIKFVKENYVGKTWPQKEGLVGVPQGWYLDRMWRRIAVKIKKEHFK